MPDSTDVYYLHELLDALERRSPQPERADAREIARAVAAMRSKATRRLAELGAQPRSGVSTR